MSIPSQHLIDQIKASEGFSASPYPCPAGRASIGYGHNLEAHPEAIRLWSENVAHLTAKGGLRGEALVKRLEAVNMVWTEEHAEQWLLHDVDAVLAELVGRCREYNGLVALGDEVRAEVLVDMAYNLGTTGLMKFKKMLAAVAVGDWDRAASEMLDSRWAEQVKGRAVDLARQMRTGVRA